MTRALLATLLAGLLWGPPLLAQDPPQKAARQAEIVRWFRLLRDPDEASRKQAKKKLVELLGNEEVVEVLARFVPAGGGLLVRRSGGDLDMFVQDMFVQIDAAGPSETIRGSWAGDGERVNYTLQKGAGTKYELKAERRRGKQVLDRLQETGTLAELRKRHPFLKGALAMTLPRMVVALDRRPRPASAMPIRSTALGATVERPSKDLAHHFFLPEGVGFIVRRVEKGSRAEKLGLKRFDLLTKIEGRWIEEVDQLAAGQGVLEYLRRAKPGRRNLKLE